MPHLLPSKATTKFTSCSFAPKQYNHVFLHSVTILFLSFVLASISKKIAHQERPVTCSKLSISCITLIEECCLQVSTTEGIPGYEEGIKEMGMIVETESTTG